MQVINPIEFYEVWKPITRMCGDIKEGIYWISTFGRVYSIAKANRYGRENGFLKPHDKDCQKEVGYLDISLYGYNGVYKHYLVHRLVMITFCPIPNYQILQVNHKDGNKHNNCIWNLEWCTNAENIKHAIRTGLINMIGENNPCSTITNAQADEVGRLIATKKYTFDEISDMTKVPKRIVSHISQGDSWKNVHDKYNLSEVMKDKYKCKFTDDQIHKLCKYFEDNKYKYSVLSDLYRNALWDLFNIRYDNNMSPTMSNIFNHKTRRKISDQYNF